MSIGKGLYRYLIFFITFLVLTNQVNKLLEIEEEPNLFSNREVIITEEEMLDYCDELEKELNVNIDSSEAEDYLLLSAILDNKNLTEEEKNIFYSAINLIKDNPYLNKQSAYSNLLKVDTIYTERPDSYSKNIQATYSGYYDQITMYTMDDFYNVFSHEAVHCIFYNIDISNLPRFFNEGMTEILNNEYFDVSPFSEYNNYPYEALAVKILCNFVGSDCVLEAYTEGDISIVIRAMAEITGTEEEAKKLLEDIETILNYHDGKIKDIKRAEFNDIYNSVISRMDKYVNESHRLEYSYNKLIFSAIKNEEIGFGSNLYLYIQYFGILKKAYFSSELKNQYTGYEIDYILDMETSKSNQFIKKV